MRLVGEVHEFFGYPLLQVKTRINLLQGRHGSLQPPALLQLFWNVADKLRKDPIDGRAQLLHLLTQSWQVVHISLATLDLLIEDNTIEALLAFNEFLSELQMSAGNKPETAEMFLHHPFSLFNSLRDLNFLVSSQQRNLSHLLQIHAHRVIQNI